MLVCLSLPLGAQEEGQLTVKIKGVNGALLDNVRAYLSLRDDTFMDKVRVAVGLGDEAPVLTETHVRRLYQRAPNEISQALKALGYYHPEIRSELRRVEDGWVAKFTIAPGPPVRITDIAFKIDGEGTTDPLFERFTRRFPLKVGGVLNDGTWEKTKSELQSLALERGYFDARLTTHRVKVNLEKNEARLTLRFDTGRRYQFGAVIFKQDSFDEHFLERFVAFKSGDPFRTSDLLNLQNALVGSDYFSTVEVRRLRDQAVDNTLPIEVILTPRSKYKFSAGLGFGTDTGPRGSLGWDIRRINRRGHRLFTAIEGSVLSRDLSGRYEIPLKNPLTEKLNFEAQAKQETTDTADSDIFTLGVRRSSEFGRGWLQNLFVNFGQEFFEVGDQESSSTLFLLGGNWTRIRADDRLYPRRGNRLYLQLQGTDTFLGSDLGFLQAQVQAKYIRGLGARQRVLLRGELGATLMDDDFEELPPTLRFFAGGSQSVRGFAFESLGPVDSSGDVIGGRYLAVGSAEYEYRFLDKWSAAIFYDIGNAFDDSDVDLAQGAGIGLRWLSPVGPIRVDFAFALSESGIPFRLDVRMGPDL